VAPEEVRPLEIRPFKTLPVTAAISAAAPLEARMGDDLAHELAELRKQIETVKRSVDRQPAAFQKGTGLSSDGTELISRLTSAEFSQDLAFELVAAAETRRAHEGSASGGLDAALRAEFEQRLQFSPSIGLPGVEPRVVLLVGPAATGRPPPSSNSRCATVCAPASRCNCCRSIPCALADGNNSLVTPASRACHANRCIRPRRLTKR